MGKNTTRANARTRPVRYDQFTKQLEELDVSNLAEVQMSDSESIWIRLGNSIDVDPDDDFEDRLRDASTSEEVAMLVLDYYPKATAAEQWETFTKHGGTADRLAILFTSLTQDQAQRLGKIRPRR